MKIIPGLITVLMCACLVSTPIYAQELTEREKKILYEAIEEDLNSGADLAAGAGLVQAQEVLKKYGITDDQLQDIVSRSLGMPLNTVEKEVAGEINEELLTVSEEILTPETLPVLKEIASRYGMGLGEVGSVLMRLQAEEE